MRVITFSRYFPVNHPRKGEPTYFVEKIWESIYMMGAAGWDGFSDVADVVPGLYSHGVHEPKHHTIRAGNRWKVGDKFSPRIWSGRPYNSKQIQIAPDIEIKKIWDFDIRVVRGTPIWRVIGRGSGDLNIQSESLQIVSKNDGLLCEDFIHWFLPIGTKFISNVPVFSGQILCWNESINYD